MSDFDEIVANLEAVDSESAMDGTMMFIGSTISFMSTGAQSFMRRETDPELAYIWTLSMSDLDSDRLKILFTLTVDALLLLMHEMGRVLDKEPSELLTGTVAAGVHYRTYADTLVDTFWFTLTQHIMLLDDDYFREEFQELVNLLWDEATDIDKRMAVSESTVALGYTIDFIHNHWPMDGNESPFDLLNVFIDQFRENRMEQLPNGS